jgi:hypothetical protein
MLCLAISVGLMPHPLTYIYNMSHSNIEVIHVQLRFVSSEWEKQHDIIIIIIIDIKYQSMEPKNKLT